MKADFIEALASGVLICDGAMGTQLYERGVPYGRCLDILNIENPNLVLGVHLDYASAGADILETNTYGANRAKLAVFGYEDRVAEINMAGARLARRAAEEHAAAGPDGARRRLFVAGAIGPLGVPLAPYGTLTPEEASKYFEEQAKALVDGGVDLIIIETFSDVKEAKAAIEGVKRATGLPVIVQMTFMGDGLTPSGVSPSSAARELLPLNPDVMGVNCGSGPYDVLSAARRLREACGDGVPLSVQPNAGVSRFLDGRVVCSSSPEYFASFAGDFIAAGARVVGGCCGTTPSHIRALARAIRSIEAGDGALDRGAETISREVTGSIALTATATIPPSARPQAKPVSTSNNILSRISDGFVVVVEVDPPKGTGFSQVLSAVRYLKEHGVHAVSIADNPMARMRMSPVALGHILQERVGIEAILHLTCRDRNLLGLQSDLIGAWALGIRNVLALTGDPPARGDHPDAAPVFDVTSTGLIRMIASLNRGVDMSGNRLSESTGFAVGAAANPSAEDLDAELRRLCEKVEAGENFVLTQPVYDVASFERFRNRAEEFGVPVIAGIMPLKSLRHAEYLHNEVPGITVPERYRRRMASVPRESAAAEGIRIAREILKEVEKMAEGVYLMPPLGSYDVVPEILEALDRR